MTISRDGRPISFGVGERLASVGTGLACWPREWEPDPGPGGDGGRGFALGQPAASVPMDIVGNVSRPIAGGALESGQTVEMGQLLVNPSKSALFVIQPTDSNAIVYDIRDPNSIRPLWSAKTLKNGQATHATMQADGNFVIFGWRAGSQPPDYIVGGKDNPKYLLPNPYPHGSDLNYIIALPRGTDVLWQSKTAGHRGARLVLTDDGALVVYDGAKGVWSSDTNGFKQVISKPDFLDKLHDTLEGAVVPVRSFIFKAVGSLVGMPSLGARLNAILPAQKYGGQGAGMYSSGGRAMSSVLPAQSSAPAVSTSATGGGAAYGPYPQPTGSGTTAGVGALDHGGHGGGGGHGGHGGGGHGGWHGGGGRFRGRGWGGGWGGRGGWGWGWGGPWWPYVVAAPSEVSCANWGDPINFPAALLPAARTTLINAGGDPVAVRGADGGLYLLSLDAGVPIGGSPGGLVTVRPCVGMVGIGSADDDVLRAMALDLIGSLRRTGAPQYATRSVKNFAQAWNAASVDAQIATDGKYTGEIEGALNAALAALSPSSGTAPAAVL